MNNFNKLGVSTDVPEGWAQPTVRHLLDVKYGKGLKQSVRHPGSVQVYGSNGVVGAHDEAITSGPTIIIGRKGTVGAVHCSPEPCWPIDTTYYVDDFSGCDVRYLEHALRSLGLEERDTSTAIPGLNRDDLYSHTLPVPPLAEQKRIVAKVEELLAHVNAARERLERVTAILKRFRQTVLAAACSGKLTEDWRAERGIVTNGEAPWTSLSLSEVCSAVVDCPHSTPKWTDQGLICLRTTNFQVEGLQLEEVRYVSEATYKKRIARLEPRPGDVVYSREGGILGIACVIPDGLKACLGQRMMLMRPDSGRLRADFLVLLLNAPVTLARVRELTGGTASPHLNVGDVKRFVIPTPPLEEQDELLRRVNQLLSAATLTGCHAVGVMDATVSLRQSLLERAFRGELVPTEADLARREGRDYEPAAALLERVRADGASAPGNGRNRKSGKSRPIGAGIGEVATSLPKRRSRRKGVTDKNAWSTEDYCYLCGDVLHESNNDHVPPRRIFPSAIRATLTVDLLTLTTHPACQDAYIRDEEYFFNTLLPNALPSKVGPLLAEDFKDVIRRDSPSAKLSQTVRRQFVTRPSGLVLPHGLVVQRVEGDRLTRIIWKVTRGLFSHHTRAFLPESTPRVIRVHGPLDGRPPECMLPLMDRGGMGHTPQCFDYTFIDTNDVADWKEERAQFWLLNLWESHLFFIVFHDPACPCEKCRGG